MPEHNKKLENEFSFSGFCWFKAVIIGVTYVMLLYTTSSSSPEVAFLLLFSEKNWIFDLLVGIISQFRLTMGRKQMLSILKFFHGIWNFFEIFLRLCFAFWILSIADLSKKTRFVVLTMFSCSFEIWKKLFADGIFHSFSMNALISSQPGNSNNSPIYLPFNFLKTFEPPTRQKLFGAL